MHRSSLVASTDTRLTLTPLDTTERPLSKAQHYMQRISDNVVSRINKKLANYLGYHKLYFSEQVWPKYIPNFYRPSLLFRTRRTPKNVNTMFILRSLSLESHKYCLNKFHAFKINIFNFCFYAYYAKSYVVQLSSTIRTWYSFGFTIIGYYNVQLSTNFLEKSIFSHSSLREIRQFIVARRY